MAFDARQAQQSRAEQPQRGRNRYNRHPCQGDSAFQIQTRLLSQQFDRRYAGVKAAALNPDSWTVRFQLPYPGVTLYGESLSAMAALNIVALAKNEPVDEETVLTGTVTPDGHVGTVGGVPLKILAAYEQHYRKVLIPEEPVVADGD